MDTITSTQTPIIADVDGDCIPEIIVTGKNDRNIIIIDSKTGIKKKEIVTPFISSTFCPFVIADVNNDSNVEIFSWPKPTLLILTISMVRYFVILQMETPYGCPTQERIYIHIQEKNLLDY